MARLPTTFDVFNAIAEPRRRQIVELLARRGNSSVGVLIASMGMPQPAVSKHLGVLHKAGVVSVSKAGRQRIYSLNAQELKSVHDWAAQFDLLWTHQLERIKKRAEEKARK